MVTFFLSLCEYRGIINVPKMPFIYILSDFTKPDEQLTIAQKKCA